MDLGAILEKLGVNATPATHAEYLAAWEQVKDMAKKLNDYEMVMRKALFKATFPTPKEGSNSFALPTGGKLVGTHKVTRSIDASQIALARAEYELVNDRPVPFDDLLKVSYELVTSAYRKVEPAAGESPTPAFLAISRMVVTKVGAPTIEVK